MLEHSLDPSTVRRLEAIGVAPGWRCLDVGAGGGTVCEGLCRRVGPTGRVTAMDLDARFLRALDYANLHVREENVVDADFPSGTFDLVHTKTQSRRAARSLETVGYVSFHGRRYSRRRNSFGSVTVPPDPLIVLMTRILAPS